MNDLFEPILDKEASGSPAILPLYGGAKKSVGQMSEEEFDQAAQSVYDKVREQAFSRGLPVIVRHGDQIVKEYADGHVEPLGV